jgi:predicted transcriptional regulator
MTPPDNSKRALMLKLTDAEMRALDALAAAKDLSKTGVMRQALRLYQLIDARLSQGERVFVENALTKEKAELALL